MGLVRPSAGAVSDCRLVVAGKDILLFQDVWRGWAARFGRPCLGVPMEWSCATRVLFGSGSR